MASLPRWTWVWVNSRSWWWTGRPGMLQFMGSQRVGHDWATELNWTEQLHNPNFYQKVEQRHQSRKLSQAPFQSSPSATVSEASAVLICFYYRLVLSVLNLSISRNAHILLYKDPFTEHILRFMLNYQCFILFYCWIEFPGMYEYFVDPFSCGRCCGCFQCQAVMIKLLWIFLCMFFGGHIFSCLFGKYLEERLLDHKAYVCLLFFKIKLQNSLLWSSYFTF